MAKQFRLYYNASGAGTGVRFPRFLFRFRKFDKNLLSSIREGTLWFAGREDFNDPFETRPIIDTSNTPEEVEKYISGLFSATVGPDASRELAAKVAQGLLENGGALWNKIVHLAHQEMAKNLSFCCFSTVCNHTLMWSHYADAHRGVCLVFDFADLALTGQFCPIEVEYHNSVPSFNYVRERLVSGRSDLFDTQYDQAIMGRKSADWSYESEIRLMSPLRGNNRYPRHALRGLIFGAKIEQASREQISTLLYDSHGHVDFAQAGLDMRSGRVLIPEVKNYSVKRKITGMARIFQPPPTAPSAAGFEGVRQDLAKAMAEILDRREREEKYSRK